jgi:hypothetical protein
MSPSTRKLRITSARKLSSPQDRDDSTHIASLLFRQPHDPKTTWARVVGGGLAWDWFQSYASRRLLYADSCRVVGRG